MKVNNNKIVSISKYFFHMSNVFLIFIYTYPGSFFGCWIYNDCKTQPQLTSDFTFFSSNHVYAFFLVSLLGFISYSKKSAFIRIITYLFFISIFLELLHLVIPSRGFESNDLSGNIAGVSISLIIFLIFKLRKKNEF